MNMNKRIAYITAGADTLYEREVIKSMSEQARLLGYDLIVLTHFVNYTDGGSYIKGDENIYSMIECLPFDGAVLNYSSYYSRALADRIEAMLARKEVPVIALDYRSRLFESCLQADREHFRELTEHFIAEHGCRRIYCLSGDKDDIHSLARINGYKDALRANGIRVRQKYIFYGDFWIHSPKKLAEEILAGRVEKPQAVVCGNDYMAMQLCISLSRGGISIPDEIVVGGFDGNPDTLRYQPSVTTYCGSNLNNAIAAVCRVHEMVSGGSVRGRVHVPTGIRIGTSCGRINASQAADNDQKTFDNSLIGNIYLHSSYSSMMNKVTTLGECSLAISQNIYLLDENSDLFVCLCSDWDGSPDAPRASDARTTPRR
ncbi:MAG: substrate-binding domain-containing protein [Ruminococcus sp.]|nr:substrate-binding domain-containing protein [Ruminococcus sp.]